MQMVAMVQEEGVMAIAIVGFALVVVVFLKQCTNIVISCITATCPFIHMSKCPFVHISMSICPVVHGDIDICVLDVGDRGC